MVSVPFSSFVPFQSPSAVHSVVFNVDQLKVIDSLTLIDCADAVNESIVGLGNALTCTLIEETAFVVPDTPEQVSVKVYVLTSLNWIDSLPEVDLVPFQSPLAEHELAFVEDQFKDIDSPSSMDEDEDENDVIDGFVGEGVLGVSVEPPPLPPPHETNTIESRREKILCIFI